MESLKPNRFRRLNYRTKIATLKLKESISFKNSMSIGVGSFLIDQVLLVSGIVKIVRKRDRYQHVVEHVVVAKKLKRVSKQIRLFYLANGIIFHISLFVALAVCLEYFSENKSNK